MKKKIIELLTEIQATKKKVKIWTGFESGGECHIEGTIETTEDDYFIIRVRDRRQLQAIPLKAVVAIEWSEEAV